MDDLTTLRNAVAAAHPSTPGDIVDDFREFVGELRPMIEEIQTAVLARNAAFDARDPDRSETRIRAMCAAIAGSAIVASALWRTDAHLYETADVDIFCTPDAFEELDAIVRKYGPTDVFTPGHVYTFKTEGVVQDVRRYAFGDGKRDVEIVVVRDAREALAGFDLSACRSYFDFSAFHVMSEVYVHQTTWQDSGKSTARIAKYLRRGFKIVPLVATE